MCAPSDDGAEMAKRETSTRTKSLSNKRYLKELAKLQLDLVKMQEWVVDKQLKVLVLFEGRDAAGKGGTIKRITESLNPRVCRIVALQKPTERERTQWYFQRYVAHLPAAGEVVLFDRSWYNRPGDKRTVVELIGQPGNHLEGLNATEVPGERGRESVLAAVGSRIDIDGDRVQAQRIAEPIRGD